MSGHISSGVPRALAVDAWWMSADAEFDAPDARVKLRQVLASRTRRRILLLVVLVALADALFFQQAVGLSIAVFVIALFAASVFEAERSRVGWGPILVLILGVLPVVDYVQFFSVIFAIFGLIVAVAWHRLGVSQSLDAVLFAARRLVFFLPLGAVQSIDAWVKTPSGEVDVSSVFRELIRNWAFPVGGGLLILSLLVSANPVLERLFANILDLDFDAQRFLQRVFFWLGAAILVWPMLSVAADRLQRPFGPQKVRRAYGFGLNATSVSNALWLFNGLLAMQLIMDGAFAISGELPYDMSYARYAHRGAYPLVVTALLAGCFALAARPFLDEGRWLKPLMVLWLALNGLLTVASMYRLGLYVEVYGLTYLRMRAGIWMVLVAIWLGLIAWQILKSKANGWLVLRSFAMGITTIYVGCFVNFAEVIARYNVDHKRFDTWYACSLTETSPTAFLKLSGTDACYTPARRAKIDGWRDWGFREWRVTRYVSNVQAKGASHENSGR